MLYRHSYFFPRLPRLGVCFLDEPAGSHSFSGLVGSGIPAATRSCAAVISSALTSSPARMRATRSAGSATRRTLVSVGQSCDVRNPGAPRPKPVAGSYAPVCGLGFALPVKNVKANHAPAATTSVQATAVTELHQSTAPTPATRIPS